MSEEIHSVILNLNSNFANNTGSNFSTIVNRQLEIKPNTLVALYKGNIVRKPIILSNETSFELLTQGASFPSELMESSIPLSNQADILLDSLNLLAPNNYSQGDIYQKLRIKMPAGKYSKLEFCRQLCELSNVQIATSTLKTREIEGYEPVAGNNAFITFPYRFAYEERDGNFWLGLRYTIDTDFFLNETFYVNATTFLDLDGALIDGKSTNRITYTDGELEQSAARGIRGLTAEDNWKSWAFGNSPIRGLCYGTSDDKDAGAFDISFAECYITCPLPTSNVALPIVREAVYALHNTYFAEEALYNDTAPDLNQFIINSKAQTAVPNVQFGARVYTTQTTIHTQTTMITLFANESIFDGKFSQFYEEDLTPPATANRDKFNGENLILLEEFDVSEYQLKLEDGFKLRYEVYCKETTMNLIQNVEAIVPRRDYYLRFLITSPYQNNYTVIYDSRNFGLVLHPLVVETGCLFQMIASYEGGANTQTTGGLCPTIFFKNSGVGDFTISNLRSQNVANLNQYSVGAGDPIVKWYVSLPIEGYKLNIPQSWDIIDNNTGETTGETKDNTNIQQLQNILRVSTVGTYGTINPNSYPIDKSINTGITSLGSDLSRYNIELNLPIKTYNTTESSDNDIGQQRTIVFNTDPVIEDTTNFASGLVNKNIIPPAIKWLSLNNPQKIQLNELLVQIRNSKTNKLAEEITDASIELIFKSHNNKSPQLDLIL